MKIWFAANISRYSYGGVGRSMRELSRQLGAKGHETRIIHAPSFCKNNYLFFSFYLAFCVISAKRKRPDWIIARSTDGAICSFLRRLLKFETRVALHNHGWEEIVAETEKRIAASIVTSPTTWKAKLIRFNLLRAALKTSDLCISGTITETRWIKKKYSSAAEKCIYIPNGVDVRLSAKWCEQKDLPPNFLIVGGETWKKNIQYATDIFLYIRKRIPDARLFLVGNGSVDNFACDSVWSGITAIPFAQWNEMDKWYSTCPYLLSASRFEGGHSLAVLEAMSYGAIVFVSPIESYTEFVRDQKNGCILSCDNAALDASRICAVCDSGKDADKIRAGAFLTAKNNTWVRQAARLERVLCAKT